MNRVDGLSFRSKPNLLQNGSLPRTKHQTNTRIHNYIAFNGCCISKNRDNSSILHALTLSLRIFGGISLVNVIVSQKTRSQKLCYFRERESRFSQ